jgi:hypothetical protein
MINELQNADFLERLEQKLLSLPSWSDRNDRNDSWMTSREIAKWYFDSGYGQCTAEEVETYLLDRSKSRSLNNIRSAKYPNLTNMQRLWGHIQRVYPQPDEMDPWKKDDPEELEEINDLPPDAPTVFLSHSRNDFELAKQVRQTLGNDYGVHTWLFENELDRDENIFGSVHLGIVHCDATLVLLTSHSIGSAWVHTEIVSSANYLNKKIITLTDGKDQELMLVIDSYLKNPDWSQFRLEAILERYKLKEKNEHRIDQFKKNAENILGFLHMYAPFSVFPSTPDEYSNSNFIDLKEALPNPPFHTPPPKSQTPTPSPPH